MSKRIQIHAVPEDIHVALRARAAQSGTSLSQYLRAQLALIASRPTPDEVKARLREQEPHRPRERPAAIIRRLRDAGR